jgi:AmmeMemoRadiSam system protein B
MNLIEKLDPIEFRNYLREYENTICGRHPISVLLNIITSANVVSKSNLKFVDYSQSSKCKNRRDSSVSYASASLILN